jgi:ABC-2 type transport system permease protein
MSAHSGAVAAGIARRGLSKAVKNPLSAVSPIAVPLFMFAAFTGALSAVGSTPSFDYYNYTAFIFVFILIEAAVFVGIFSGIEIASDFQGGFGDRMMLAAPKRLAILGGYLLFALCRALFAMALIWAIALATGMPVRGDAIELFAVNALAVMLGMTTTLWAAGVALRMRSVAAGALIFMPSFLVLFLTPAFTPRPLIPGWLHTVADGNPVTPAMEGGRHFLAHTSANVGLTFGTTAGLLVLLTVWGVRGMRVAERGPAGNRTRGRRRGDGEGGGRRRGGPGGRRARGAEAAET